MVDVTLIPVLLFEIRDTSPGSPASLLRQGFVGSLHLSSGAAKLRRRIAEHDT
jgi:hypothetical protein